MQGSVTSVLANSCIAVHMADCTALHGLLHGQVKLPGHPQSCFWRFHTEGVSDAGVCTIEALHLLLTAIAGVVYRGGRGLPGWRGWVVSISRCYNITSPLSQDEATALLAQLITAEASASAGWAPLVQHMLCSSCRSVVMATIPG